LAKDPSSEVRKEICIALCLLAACKADFMADPTICSFVIEFLLWTTEHDEDYDVKKEACEFWQTVCDNDDIPPGVLKPYLSRLTLVLLNGMVYSEDELNALQEEDDKEDDEDDDSQQWTLRKCSALGLDVISNHYKDEILDALLPHIDEKLSRSDWKVQESAVLAMGALAKGCKEGLKSLNYLHSFINHLITAILPCQHPLLRSITCWTLSRYANFIAAAPDVPGPLLPQMVMG
jgi:transportin-1